MQPDIIELGFDAWLVYQGLILEADDEGRGVLDIVQIATRSGLRHLRLRYPLACTSRALSRVARVYKVRLYKWGNVGVYQIVKWGRYQSLWHQTPSKLPASGPEFLPKELRDFFGIELEEEKEKKPTSYRKSPSGGRQSASGRSELLKNTTNETPAEVQAKLRADGWALPEEAGE